jgi:hypothetical protein
MRRLAVLLAVASLGLAAVTNVKRLEWTDPHGRQPLTYSAWTATRPAALGAARIGSIVEASDANVVDVVVNAELYPSISVEIAQYQTDLADAGYSVQIDTMRGTSAPALRSHLAGISQLVGAVLVGELPVAWYERAWSGGETEEFPIELYFMDLNGTWTDADADGLYDSHTGSTAPEIWVGRLYARPLAWDDEVRLMKRYFAKNHAYRMGELGLPDRGLTYIDDDWVGMDSSLSLVYSDMTVIEDNNTTRAADYRTRLTDGYEWLEVCCHSSPWGHTWRYNGGYGGTVFNTEIYAIRPHAHFYNLFACSGTRFVEENYSAGWDIFQDDYGLCAIGSAKTGSMLNFGDFHSPLGQGKSIGEAFKSWFIANGESDPDWFYGMNTLGDPTLKPHGNAGKWGLSRNESDELLRGTVPGFPPRIPSQSRALAAEVVCSDPETDDSPRLLAMPDGKVWAIWKSGRSTVNGRFDIYASVRSGGTWSSPYHVGSAEYWETDPVLGLDRFDRPVAVWSLFTDQYYYNLIYSVWNGSSWSTPQTISDDPSADLKAALCRDATDTLWCFWYSRRDLDADIFASRFNGTSWTTPVNLTNDTFAELCPAAAAMPNGHVWVAYTKYRNGGSEVWARHWDGSTWTETGPVSGAQKRALRPAITNLSNSPLVCWQSFDSGNGDICYSVYDGANWSTPAAVDSDTGLDVHPSLTTDPWNSQYLVWMSFRNGEWDVYCARYMTPLGWTEAWPLETDNGPDVNPDVAADSTGDIFAVWQNLTAGNWDINAKAWQTDGIAEQPQLGAERLLVQPNPARGRVRLMLPKGSTSAVITDATGRRVRELPCAGTSDRTLVWDGRDNSGRLLAPGVYLVRVPGSIGSPTRKVLLVR